MHFPAVCEGTVSNLHRSLVESRMEGGDGRRTPLLLSTTDSGPFSKPCTAASLTKVKGPPHEGKERREDTETLWSSILQEDSGQKSAPWPCSACIISKVSISCKPLHLQTFVSEDYQEKSGKPKKLLLLLDLQFSSLHSCSSRDSPAAVPIVQRELTLPFSSLYYFAF